MSGLTSDTHSRDKTLTLEHTRDMRLVLTMETLTLMLTMWPLIIAIKRG